jgi:hypothetical protein
VHEFTSGYVPTQPVPKIEESGPVERLTMKSRPLAQLCSCGRPTVQYMTSDGLKAATYCAECAKRTDAHR